MIYCSELKSSNIITNITNNKVDVLVMLGYNICKERDYNENRKTDRSA